MYTDFINEISKTIDINNIFTNKEVNKYIIELKDKIINISFNKKHILKINDINNIKLYNILYNLLNNNCNFIDKIILDDINKYKYTKIFYYENIYFIYTSYNKLTKLEINDIYKYIYIIYSLKKIVNNNKLIFISVWSTNFKKEFPEKNKILNSYNCNSGATFTFGRGNGVILIWRKEELQKVLIHELIHALKIDINIYNNELYNINFLNIKNLKNNINIFESYTELLATILNIIYYSIFNNVNNNKIYKLYDLELKHSLIKASQILKFNNFNNINDVLTSDKEFTQDTSVFSYYIIKMILFYNIKYFINLIKNKCFEDNNIIFQNNINCKINYLNIIKCNLINNKLNKLLQDLIKHPKIMNNNSMRMTLIE